MTKENQLNQQKLFTTTIMLGILLFGLVIIAIVILSAKIETNIECTATGIKYDKQVFDEVMNQENIITNTDYLTSFELNNSTISCKGYINMPAFMIGVIQ